MLSKDSFQNDDASGVCRLGEHHRAPFEFFTVKPWEKGLGKVSVFPALSGVSGRDDNVTQLE